MSHILQSATQGTTRILRLNRPDVRNALNKELVEALLAALHDAHQDTALRAVVLTGEGKDFCAGADLKGLRQIADRSFEENREDSKQLASLFRHVHTHRLPVIAAVQGAALAGGCGLACVCDFVIAGERARFALTEARIGFVAAIVTRFLIDRIGHGRTRDLLLSARFVEAPEALAIGLVNEVVADDTVLDAALEKAAQLAKNSGSSLAISKRLLAELPDMGLEVALDYAARLNAETRATPECKEGISAFLEKREPSWRS